MTAALSTLAEIDATIARLEAYIDEANRALAEVQPAKYLLHIPRDPVAWPNLHGHCKTAGMIRSDIAYCERKLQLFRNSRANLVPAEENAA